MSSVNLFPDVTALENAFAEYDEIDLLIYDSPMPAISCQRSVRRLRQFDRDLPVILLTAIPDYDENGEKISAGFDKLIYNPVDWQLLLKEIKQLLADRNVA